MFLMHLYMLHVAFVFMHAYYASIVWNLCFYSVRQIKPMVMEFVTSSVQREMKAAPLPFPFFFLSFN